MMRLNTLICAAALAIVWHGTAFAAFRTHLGAPADDVVTLEWMCNVDTPTRILVNGDRVPDFEVPRRHALVITDLEFRVTTSSENIGENYVVELQLSPAAGPVSFVYLGFMPLVQFRGYLRDHLTAGLVHRFLRTNQL